MRDYKTIEDLVCFGGTPSGDCQLCGRCHFAGGSESCEEPEELDRLRKLAQEQPEKYIESEDDSLGLGWIDGHQIIWGCPCKKVERYEQFIWDNRELIVKYIAGRNAAIAAEAAKLTTELSSVQGVAP